MLDVAVDSWLKVSGNLTIGVYLRMPHPARSPMLLQPRPWFIDVLQCMAPVVDDDFLIHIFDLLHKILQSFSKLRRSFPAVLGADNTVLDTILDSLLVFSFYKATVRGQDC